MEAYFGNTDIAIIMGGILGGIGMALFVLNMFLTPKNDGQSSFLPSQNNLPKKQFEEWCLIYSAIWICLFGIVIVTQAYEYFTEWDYMSLMVVIVSPFLLQPFLFPVDSEKNMNVFETYAFKANVWIAIFSFIGNYWYTHYFYCVLKAEYLFPAHRLNDVPICLFLATHFYFVTYHTFANLILRKIETTYKSDCFRHVFFWSCIFAFSYFTAFMETLTISSFPYYRFEDRFMAYTLGSAFYGIYFIVSFPAYFQLNEYVGKVANARPHTLYQTVMESFGASMIVLCLLDICRLYLNVPLQMSGVLYYVYKNKDAIGA